MAPSSHNMSARRDATTGRRKRRQRLRSATNYNVDASRIHTATSPQTAAPFQIKTRRSTALQVTATQHCRSSSQPITARQRTGNKEVPSDPDRHNRTSSEQSASHATAVGQDTTPSTTLSVNSGMPHHPAASQADRMQVNRAQNQNHSAKCRKSLPPNNFKNKNAKRIKIFIR